MLLTEPHTYPIRFWGICCGSITIVTSHSGYTLPSAMNAPPSDDSKGVLYRSERLFIEASRTNAPVVRITPAGCQ